MVVLHRCLLILLIFCINSGYGQNPQKHIIIAGEFARDIKAKEVTLFYWEEVISYSSMEFTARQRMVAPIRDGKFRFEIHPQNSAVYLKIGWEYKSHIMVDQNFPHLYVAESGDSVNLKIDTAAGRYRIRFEGRGAAKYAAILSRSQNHLPLKRDWNKRNSKIYDPNDYKSWRINKAKNAADYLLKKQLAGLNRSKVRLGEDVYNLYKADIFSKIYLDHSRGLNKLLARPPLDEPISSVKTHIKGEVVRLERKLKWFASDVDERILSRSAYYIDLLFSMAKVKAELEDISVFDVITKLEPRLIRDKVLANYFITRSSFWDSVTKDSLSRQAVAIIADPFCQQEVTQYMEGSQVGGKAYNFSLPDMQGKEIRLSDFRGKVVFIDFWYAGCGGCAAYYREVVKGVKERYKDDSDVVFIAISIDRDRERWLEYVRKGVYTSEEAVNLHCTDGTENPIIQQFQVTYYPHPLLIDREGRVFSDSSQELRLNGVEGLVDMIEKAKKGRG